MSVGWSQRVRGIVAGAVSGVLARAHLSFVISSIVAQLAPLASLPILARLYSPAEFGSFAVFYALITVLGCIATLSLTNAIFTSQDDRSAFHAVLLTSACSLALVALMALMISALPTVIVQSLVGPNVSGFIKWLPIAVLASSFYNIAYAWAVRAGEFALLARNKLILSIVTAILQIAIGLARPGTIGLIAANFLGTCVAIALFCPSLVRAWASLGNALRLADVLEALRRNRNIPRWTLPATLVNQLSQFAPEFTINRIFGAAALGSYSLGNRLIFFPLNLIASAIQDVFRQQASVEYSATGACLVTTRKFLALLVILALSIVAPLIVASPYIIPFFLGPHWIESIGVVQTLAFLVGLRFVSSPLSYVWILTGHERWDFWWQVGLLFVTVSAFLLPQAGPQGAPFRETLAVYAVAAGFWYAVCIVVSIRLARGPYKQQQL